MLQAAKDLHKFGPKYVLIKGGHLIATPSDPSTSHPQPAPSSTPSQPPSTASASQDSESTPVHEGNSASESMQASNQAGSESNADGSLEGAGLQGQAQSQNSSEEAAAQSTAQHNGECLHHLSQATTTNVKQTPLDISTCCRGVGWSARIPCCNLTVRGTGTFVQPSQMLRCCACGVHSRLHAVASNSTCLQAEYMSIS